MHAGPQGEKRSSLPDQCNTRLLNIERGKCVHTFIEYHKPWAITVRLIGLCQ